MLESVHENKGPRTHTLKPIVRRKLFVFLLTKTNRIQFDYNNSGAIIRARLDGTIFSSLLASTASVSECGNCNPNCGFESMSLCCGAPLINIVVLCGKICVLYCSALAQRTWSQLTIESDCHHSLAHREAIYVLLFWSPYLPGDVKNGGKLVEYHVNSYTFVLPPLILRLDVHSCTEQPATQNVAIICATTRRACAYTTRTPAVIAWRMDIIVHSRTVSRTSDRRSTTSRNWRRYRMPRATAIWARTGQTPWTRSGIWWTKTPSGRTPTMCSPITRRSPASDRHVSADRDMRVPSITIARTSGEVRANSNIGRRPVPTSSMARSGANRPTVSRGTTVNTATPERSSSFIQRSISQPNAMTCSRRATVHVASSVHLPMLNVSLVGWMCWWPIILTCFIAAFIQSDDQQVRDLEGLPSNLADIISNSLSLDTSSKKDKNDLNVSKYIANGLVEQHQVWNRFDHITYYVVYFYNGHCGVPVPSYRNRLITCTCILVSVFITKW